MKIATQVIPNEDNDEEDLSRCSPHYEPLPAIRLGKGVWLARWTLSAAERQIVAQGGDIYIRMHAIDGDELIMPHSLFVSPPNVQKLRRHYGYSGDDRRIE